MKFRISSIGFLLQAIGVCLVLCSLALAQDLAAFEKRTTVKKLANGLTVIICERPEAPVFSFFTHVDAGSVQDPMKKTGLAHMFEHMAFKGTERRNARAIAETIENVGGDLDAVTGKRVTFAFFPWNWDRGDGCIIRLVAMIDKSQNYRIEKGASF